MSFGRSFNFARLLDNVAMSPPGRSVLPTELKKRVSPLKRRWGVEDCGSKFLMK